MFLNANRNCITKCISTGTVSCSQKDPDFVTPFIKDLLNKRKKLRKSGRVIEANLLVNKINNLICESRKRRLSTVSEASTHDLWVAVKPNKHKTDCVNNIFYNVDAANKFFADIATDPDYDLEHVNALRPSLCHKCDSNFQEHCPIADFRMELILRRIKRTSPGRDNIPYWVYKKCSFERADVVAHIFDLSFITGSVPTAWLSVIVTPVPKIPKPLPQVTFALSQSPPFSQGSLKNLSCLIGLGQPLLPVSLMTNLHFVPLEVQRVRLLTLCTIFVNFWKLMIMFVYF